MKKYFSFLVFLSIFIGCKNPGDGGFTLSETDTIINGKPLKLCPVLIDSFSSGQDVYRIFAAYTFVPVESDTLKCFESLKIYKNGCLFGILYQTDLLALFNADNIRLSSVKKVDMIEIANMDNITFCINFIPNMSTPGSHNYSFFQIKDKLYTIDSVIHVETNWFDSDKISAENGCFDIMMDNCLYGFKVPVKLENDGSKLRLSVNIHETRIDSNYVFYDFNSNGGDYSKSTDSIYLYPDYRSADSEAVFVPLKNLKNVKFTKTIRLYKNGISSDFQEFIYDTRDKGTYGSYANNDNISWFLFLESDSIKGWVRKLRDYGNIGFGMYQ